MRHTFVATLAASCFACGQIAPVDATSSDAGTDAGAGTTSTVATTSNGGPAASLTIPIGQYTSCNASLVNVAGNLTASNGGTGTVTLSLDGKGGLAAALSFEDVNVGNPSADIVVASGTIGFVPTSTTTGALNAATFELRTLDANNASATIPVAASALSLVGDTLFVSIHGSNADTTLSAFVTCPVPSSLPKGTAFAPSTTSASIPFGSYAGCTSASGELSGSTSSGGDLSLSLTRASDGTVTIASTGGYPDVCGNSALAFHDVGGGTGALNGAQTCAIELPCGPPPSLGPSSAPNVATLTNMAGSVQLVADTLFVNLAGDASSGACGGHAISLICPNAP